MQIVAAVDARAAQQGTARRRRSSDRSRQVPFRGAPRAASPVSTGPTCAFPFPSCPPASCAATSASRRRGAGGRHGADRPRGQFRRHAGPHGPRRPRLARPTRAARREAPLWLGTGGGRFRRRQSNWWASTPCIPTCSSRGHRGRKVPELARLCPHAARGEVWREQPHRHPAGGRCPPAVLRRR